MDLQRVEEKKEKDENKEKDEKDEIAGKQRRF